MILVINPGSTSTKVGLFEGTEPVDGISLSHGRDQLDRFPRLNDQIGFRRGLIEEWLAERERQIGAIAARGGLLHPLEGGTYEVNEDMCRDLREARYGVHASNLGALIAVGLASRYGVKAYVVDPVVVDELRDEARYSGSPRFARRSIFHALNQKAVARRAASALGMDYSACRLVVAHLGGGISVGAHEGGRVVDVNDALAGEGPMSPERAGSLPLDGILDLCAAMDYDREAVMKALVGGGGLVAHLGSNDLREIERRIDEGDARAALVVEAMVYQVAKEIGRALIALEGPADAIVLTGGLAHSQRVVSGIRGYVGKAARVLVFPGEDEMKALAAGVQRVLAGVEKAKTYVRQPGSERA